MLSLYLRNLTNCIKMAPETAIKFTAHSMILRVLKESHQNGGHSSQQQYHLNFIAGAGAGAVSQTLIYPLEIAKTRLALSQPGQYRNFVDCISSIYKWEGARSLYNGWTASISGIIPYCAIEMGMFFTIKDRWHQRYGAKSQPDVPSLFAMGVTASVSGMLSLCFVLEMALCRNMTAQGPWCLTPFNWFAPSCKHRECPETSTVIPDYGTASVSLGNGLGFSDCTRGSCPILRNPFPPLVYRMSSWKRPRRFSKTW